MIDSRSCLYAVLAVLATAVIGQRATRRKIANPPSPLSLPLVGNLFAIPSGPEYQAFTKLGKDLNSKRLGLRSL